MWFACTWMHAYLCVLCMLLYEVLEWTGCCWVKGNVKLIKILCILKESFYNVSKEKTVAWSSSDMYEMK